MGERAPGLVLCWVGKTTADYARIGLIDYLERIRRFRACKIVTVPEEPQGKRYTRAHRLEREGRRILRCLQQLEPVYTVALDPHGRLLNSSGFARLVQRRCYEDTRALAMVVGGPDGLDPSICAQADELLSLSPMTLPHDMARLVLVEQIYRSFTLIHRKPYSR